MTDLGDAELQRPTLAALLVDLLDPLGPLTVGPLPPLLLSLTEAHGCVLADDSFARHDNPDLDRAAVEGYAVRAADLETAATDQPVRLLVVADVRAGSPRPLLDVRPGQTARVARGAPLAPGTNAVVADRHTDGGLDRVFAMASVAVGAGVEAAGSQLRSGELVLRAGTRLGPAHLGLLAAAGYERVAVRPRPRVVLVTVGDGFGPGRPDPIGPMLAAAVAEAGAWPFVVPPLPLDPVLLRQYLEDQLVRADMLVVAGLDGGVASRLLLDVIGRMGQIRGLDARVEPGGELAVGRCGEEQALVLVLPADHSSCHVLAEMVARPLVRAMLGATPLERPRIAAITDQDLLGPSLAADVRAVPVRLVHRDGRHHVDPVVASGLRGLADAMAYALVGPGGARAGEAVATLVLERRLS